MKRLIQDISAFINCKVYMFFVGLVALCSYGFTITHYSIGMDDTAIPLYFEEGVAPLVGRWSLFVINKVLHIHIGGFAPWMIELLSVIILMLSATLWCVMWKRICEPKISIPLWSYLFVAGIFISCPLISEVFVFYLHNGICTGYGVTALALLCLLESFSVKNTKLQRLRYVLWASILLTIALGFYESFAIVYAFGGITAFLLVRRLYGKNEKDAPYLLNVFLWARNGCLAGVISVLLRTVILAVLKAAYHLEHLEVYNVLYRQLFGNNFWAEGELIMNLKRFWVMYYVNAIVYFPITVLVIAFLIVMIYSFYYGIRKKDIMLPLCSIAIVLMPILMSIVEGLPTRYRSSQYVPVVGAFAVLLLLIEFTQYKVSQWFLTVSYFLLSVLIYNQCVDINKWFYIDYLKYQDAAAVMEHVAYDLKADFDISKPIVFRGAYRVPYEIVKDAYCSFSSPQYRWICLITDSVDPYLKEKYFAENGMGYAFAEMPLVSTLRWGISAFDGTAGQLIAFWNMHGYSSFQCVTDLAVIEEAEQIRTAEDMPGYPRSGYIKECDDYIIVNLESW